ncbi:MAG: hypothetical protein HDS78_00475 [Bacteroidales bacterium]|nr:hypothetical protein [Bacteroidales bacterium]
MTEISAFDISPNDSLLAKDIFTILEENFKAESIIYLKETNKIYKSSQIEELANDIVSVRELANKKGRRQVWKYIMPFVIGLFLLSPIWIYYSLSESKDSKNLSSPIAEKGWAFVERQYDESTEIQYEGSYEYPKEAVSEIEDKMGIKNVSNIVKYYTRGYNKYGIERQDTLFVFYKNGIPSCCLSTKQMFSEDFYGKSLRYNKLEVGGFFD